MMGILDLPMSKPHAVIFDLDQTLVHSSALDSLRRARKWQEVYARIPEVKAQDGLLQTFQRLRDAGIPVAVVTSSPRSYCTKMLEHCGFQPDVIVCYHDTKRHKPDPEPLLLALEKLNIPASRNVVAIGDTETDVEAAKRAGLFAVGVTWGIEDASALRAGSPDAIVDTTEDLDALILPD